MARIAALGERHRIQALALAGAEVHPASTHEQLVAAWRELDPEVSVLVLTPEAAGVLGDRLGERRDLLVTVLP